MLQLVPPWDTRHHWQTSRRIILQLPDRWLVVPPRMPTHIPTFCRPTSKKTSWHDALCRGQSAKGNAEQRRARHVNLVTQVKSHVLHMIARKWIEEDTCCLRAEFSGATALKTKSSALRKTVVFVIQGFRGGSRRQNHFERSGKQACTNVGDPVW